MSNAPYTFSNPAGVTVLVTGFGQNDSYYTLAGASMNNLNMMFTVNKIHYQDMSGTAICSGNISLDATVQFAKNPLDLKWYINDQEETGMRNQLNGNVTLTPGNYSVKMEVKGLDDRTHTIVTDFTVELPAAVTAPTMIFLGGTANLSPSTGGTWISLDPTVATVDNNGVITGVSDGEARFEFTSTAGCSVISDIVKVVSKSCAADGQLLFREDFGGNDPLDDRISKTGLPAGKTDYTFQASDELKPDRYTLVKYINPASQYAWQKDFSDHTNPDDKNRGYMFLVDASSNPDKFYETQITGLCDNINQLYFSAWVANVIPTTNITAVDDPILKFELSDSNGKIVATYITPSVPRDSEGDVKWKNYGFAFDPKGYSSLTLKIYNNETGSMGNDFALDDIEVRLCVPPITVESNPAGTVCVGAPLTLKASYSDIDLTFTASGKEMAYRWEYSVDGNKWSVIRKDSLTASSTVQSIYIIDKVSELDRGYYRFIVSNPGTIDSPACRVVSKNIPVDVVGTYKASDFRAMIVPATAPHTVYLSSFIDTVNATSVKWHSSGSPDLTDDETGALDTQKFISKHVYTYKYTVTSKCGTSTAKAYVFSSTDKVPVKNNREIFVCESMESSKYVNLNQILGLENNGTWTYIDDANKIVENNVAISSAKYGNSRIFNAQKAYAEASQSTAYDVAGKPNMKAFKFQYTAVNGKVYNFTVVAGE
jgi:hypothetical protein